MLTKHLSLSKFLRVIQGLSTIGKDRGRDFFQQTNSEQDGATALTLSASLLTDSNSQIKLTAAFHLTDENSLSSLP